VLEPILSAVGAPAGELLSGRAGGSGARHAAALAGNARLFDSPALHGPAHRKPSGEGAAAGFRQPGAGAGAPRGCQAAGVNDRVTASLPIGRENMRKTVIAAALSCAA